MNQVGCGVWRLKDCHAHCSSNRVKDDFAGIEE